MGRYTGTKTSTHCAGAVHAACPGWELAPQSQGLSGEGTRRPPQREVCECDCHKADAIPA